MQVIYGFFHGALLDRAIESGNRENFTTIMLIAIATLSNKPVSNTLLIAAPVGISLISPKPGVNWLNDRIEPFAEAALLCSAVALSVLGYGTPYGWAITASLATGIFSRCDFAPKVVENAFRQIQKLGGLFLLLHPSLPIRIMGLFEIFTQINTFFEERSVKRAVNLAEYQQMGNSTPKLSRAHIYMEAKLELNDLPEIDLKGFEQLSEQIAWDKQVLANAWANKDDIISSISKAVAYIKELPESESHLSIKLKHVLEKLPNCTPAIQRSALCHLAYDGVHPLKLVEMIDDLYNLVCAPQLKPNEIPLQAALLDTLERYRKRQIERKVQGLASNLHENHILQKIMGEGYLIPKAAPQNLKNFLDKLSRNPDLFQDQDFCKQLLETYLPYMLKNFDFLFKALSLGDILWAQRDKLRADRSYFSAGEMYASYEKGIVSIIQNSIDKTPMLNHARVDAWLADWATREKIPFQREDFYEDGHLKPKAIALMLIECGIAKTPSS